MSSVCEPAAATVIEFAGCLDTDKCMEIEAEVRSKLAGKDAPVVFDVAKVDFVSSFFLRICIIAARQAGPHGFRIVNASPFVRRVFKIAGLNGMLDGQ
jgi:anti-anti-sigma factor